MTKERLSMADFARLLNTSRSRITQLAAQGLPVRDGRIDRLDGLRWVAGNVGGASAKAKGGIGLADRAAAILREPVVANFGDRVAFAREICMTLRKTWTERIAQIRIWDKAPVDERAIHRRLMLMEMLFVVEDVVLAEYVRSEDLPRIDWSAFEPGLNVAEEEDAFSELRAEWRAELHARAKRAVA